MPFCKSCGAQVEENVQFCPACGKPTDEAAPMPTQPKVSGGGAMYVAQTSSKDRKLALILCLLGFVGLAGFHRFYVGKMGTGLLWFFTFGFFFIGTFFDMLGILMGSFTDNVGAPMRQW